MTIAPLSIHSAGACCSSSCSSSACGNDESGATFADALAKAQASEESEEVHDLRAELPALILPSFAAVARLSSELESRLSQRFAEHGLPNEPAVAFSVDPYGGIHLSGERDDLHQIEALVASDPDLQRSIRDLNAISSHVHAIHSQGHLQFQEEYRASRNPEAVVAKYWHLFTEQRPADIRVTFGATGVDVLADGGRLGASSRAA